MAKVINLREWKIKRGSVDKVGLAFEKYRNMKLDREHFEKLIKNAHGIMGWVIR